MIRSAVLIQYTRVTDGRTDGIDVAYIRAIAYMLSRVKTRLFDSCVNDELHPTAQCEVL